MKNSISKKKVNLFRNYSLKQEFTPSFRKVNTLQINRIFCPKESLLIQSRKPLIFKERKHEIIIIIIIISVTVIGQKCHTQKIIDYQFFEVWSVCIIKHCMQFDNAVKINPCYIIAVSMCVCNVKSLIFP